MLLMTRENIVGCHRVHFPTADMQQTNAMPRTAESTKMCVCTV